jgi:hypothetical protein
VEVISRWCWQTSSCWFWACEVVSALEALSSPCVLRLCDYRLEWFEPFYSNCGRTRNKCDQYATIPSAHALVDIHNSTGYTRSNPRQLTANYTYSISATGSLFVLSVHVIQSFAYVDVGDTMIVMEPDKSFTRSIVVDDPGNDVLRIRLQSQSSGDSARG